MKKHSAFPKIGQYRQVVKEAKQRAAYSGKDENGNPIYDYSKVAPTITFKGTVKLHGTNAGIGHTQEDGLWVQSRSNIITPENDNYGFAQYVEDNKEAFMDQIEHVRYVNPQLKPNDGVFIFGEWAGKNIQKGVGISQIEKSWFIFDVKIVPEDGSDAYHLPSDYLRDKDARIYNIEDFLCYEIEIDFNMPEAKQNELGDITIAVEELCPVAKEFGDYVLVDNTIFEDENGKIWFEKENGFEKELINYLKPKLKKMRKIHPKGVNHVKFSI